MAADGTIKIYTDVDTKGVTSGTRRIENSMSKLGGTIKKIGGLIAAAFAVQKVVQFGKECLELGSDLQEVQNVVDSVFTTMSDKVDEFAKNAAVTAGLSETMAKKYTGTFGAMAKSFGFSESQALDMSTALTQLSGDVASFYNLTQDEAYTKLKSVFTGETESLKELGVVMTQAALDEYALANGYGKTTAAMTEQEKVALRYKFVMSQLSTASGDFIRTSDGWANQVRILKLQFESLKATIGQGLINIFTPVLKVINILLAKLATVANAFKSFTELITGKQSSGNTGAASAGLTDTGFSSIWTILLEGYNTYIVPVIEGLSERFQELMEGPFGETVAKVEEFLGKLIDSIKLLWESVLLPLFEWIASNIMPILAPIVQFIGDTVFSVIESIINIVGDIADTLSGIIDFIVGVFTGDWKLAWEGIKEVFTGIWNFIKDFITGIWDAIKVIFEGALDIVVSLVKTAWNGIKTLTKTVWNALKKWLSNTWNSIKTTASSIWEKIKDKIVGFADTISDRVHDIFSGMRDKIAEVFDGIVDFIKEPLNKAISFANSAIGMINGALGGLESALSFGPWDIPTPFGTQTIGFSVSMPRVSELPYLAQGAVIPPNAPFAAVLGDQRSGNNLEAPESLIRKIVREESGGNNVYKIPVTISGRQLMEIVIDEATLKQARSGKNPLVTLGGA